ncbi:acyl-CoA dehydrogenase [Pacificimonas flava]|uniref:Acyl-CoA dehydrogenase n=2 Tax=Pacificimonas TaxID=1960290 RepID=A0A219B3H0_9SPHN|nr:MULTISPECIES: acyl-CoA dehydrogenase family protein [Pacificimonas]MBZ6377985.1 acyl-CoA dehydrogenase family protein [Pacificimonas aurantium]OWV32368.1 acyl-CoA dehydrogenase [Pacificimonas flava]
MDFELSPEHRDFREEVRAWLADNLTDDLKEVGQRQTSVYTHKDHNLRWQAILNEKGWVAPGWPKQYGGTGWDLTQRYIWAAETARAGAPNLAPMGLGMVAHVIQKFGTDQQKDFYLPRILSGEDYWCQGYSEPGSGSDLASLAMRAKDDGDHYILNGSKIWTTHAHLANRMFALVRTDTSGKKQEGITFLLLDMDTPGVEVRPIEFISGDHEVNEVFFTDARVPKTGILGEENDGWTVAKYLLEFERSSSYAPGLKVKLGLLADDAREAGIFDDPSIRRRFAELAADLSAIETTEQRLLAEAAKGGSPGPMASMLKVLGTEMGQTMQKLAVDIAGPWAAIYQPQVDRPGDNRGIVGPDRAALAAPSYFNGRAESIYAGSNEIQRNILAKVMGL